MSEELDYVNKKNMKDTLEARKRANCHRLSQSREAMSLMTTTSFSTSLTTSGQMSDILTDKSTQLVFKGKIILKIDSFVTVLGSPPRPIETLLPDALLCKLT